MSSLHKTVLFPNSINSAQAEAALPAHPRGLSRPNSAAASAHLTLMLGGFATRVLLSVATFWHPPTLGEVISF